MSREGEALQWIVGYASELSPIFGDGLKIRLHGGVSVLHSGLIRNQHGPSHP
jgi:hypothetical protein